MFIQNNIILSFFMVEVVFCYGTYNNEALTGSATYNKNNQQDFGFPGPNNHVGNPKQGYDWEKVKRSDDVRPIYENQDDFFIFDQQNMYTIKPPQRTSTTRKTNTIRPASVSTSRPIWPVPSFRPSEITTKPPFVAIPGMGTTKSACETICPTTPQYNPVCGDDNVTYATYEKLICAQKCGKAVRLLHYGACTRRRN